MKILISILLVIVTISSFAQKFSIIEYSRCDNIGFSYALTHGDTLPDTCNWNVFYKADTCTALDYNCRTVDTCAVDSCVQFSGSGSGVIDYGTTSTFNYIHRTGIFRIELEFRASWTTGTQVLFSNTTSTVNGIYVYTTNGTTLNIYMRSNNAVVLNSSWANALVNFAYPYSGQYPDNTNHLTLVGDGTGVTLYSGYGTGAETDLGKLNYSGSIVNSGDAAFGLSFGRTKSVSNYNNIETYIRYVKFYTSTDISAPYAYFPMNTTATQATESLLGLTGTITGNYMINVGRCNSYIPCISEGWKTSISNLVKDTVTVNLKRINAPVYLYASAQPQPYFSGATYGVYYGTVGVYVLIMPRKTPISIQKKFIKNGTLLFSTITHSIYSYDSYYNGL